jgi:dihydrodipicolinate synthase/N-acetylneuraminate lyase
LFIETNPTPVKAALAMMGMIEEEYRLPLVPMNPRTGTRCARRSSVRRFEMNSCNAQGPKQFLSAIANL